MVKFENFDHRLQKTRKTTLGLRNRRFDKILTQCKHRGNILATKRIQPLELQMDAKENCQNGPGRITISYIFENE